MRDAVLVRLIAVLLIALVLAGIGVVHDGKKTDWLNSAPTDYILRDLHEEYSRGYAYHFVSGLLDLAILAAAIEGVAALMGKWGGRTRSPEDPTNPRHADKVSDPRVRPVRMTGLESRRYR